MAAEKLLLKGRYMKKVTQYAVGAGAAVVVSGVAIYIYAKSRQAKAEEYIKNAPLVNKVKDERLLRFAGFQRDERFPNVPFLDNSEGAYDEFFEKFKAVDVWLIIEKSVLSAVDHGLKDYFPDLFLTGVRENWIESEERKQKCQQALTEARHKLSLTVMGDIQKLKLQDKIDVEELKKLPEAKMLAVRYFLELAKQRRQGFQEVPTPLAVKYLPKNPAAAEE